jgi:hypothetical protein
MEVIDSAPVVNDLKELRRPRIDWGIKVWEIHWDRNSNGERDLMHPHEGFAEKRNRWWNPLGRVVYTGCGKLGAKSFHNQRRVGAAVENTSCIEPLQLSLRLHETAVKIAFQQAHHRGHAQALQFVLDHILSMEDIGRLR